VNFSYLEKYSLTSNFFWLVIFSTSIGVALSFTRLRKLEGAGSSKMGSIFIYILVLTIGLKMDLLAIFQNPGLFLLGFIWIGFHVTLLIIVAKLIRTERQVDEQHPTTSLKLPSKYVCWKLSL